MHEIEINKFEKLNENRGKLRSATPLYNIYINEVDELNRVKITKPTLAKRLNVTRRTVGNWVHALHDAGIIKYKYSGTARLNPKVYFSGSADNYKKANEEYERFKGDL